MSAVNVMIEPEILGPYEESALGPALPMLKVLHRHEDGYIAFAVEEEDKGFRPSFAIKASALESMFPGYAERLVRNSFMSINAGYRLAHRSERSPKGVKKVWCRLTMMLDGPAIKTQRSSTFAQRTAT